MAALQRSVVALQCGRVAQSTCSRLLSGYAVAAWDMVPAQEQGRASRVGAARCTRAEEENARGCSGRRLESMRVSGRDVSADRRRFLGGMAFSVTLNRAGVDSDRSRQPLVEQDHQVQYMPVCFFVSVLVKMLLGRLLQVRGKVGRLSSSRFLKIFLLLSSCKNSCVLCTPQI